VAGVRQRQQWYHSYSLRYSCNHHHDSAEWAARSPLPQPELHGKTRLQTLPIGKRSFLEHIKRFTPNIGFLSADGAKAVLSFLNSDNDTKVLSTPRTITLDNEPPTFPSSAATRFSMSAQAHRTPRVAPKTTYVETGTKLIVTPRISANDLIRLTINPEVSDDAARLSRSLGGYSYQADAYDIRRINTQVLIPSGNTLVMGGLVSDATTKGYSKWPVSGRPASCGTGLPP